MPTPVSRRRHRFRVALLGGSALVAPFSALAQTVAPNARPALDSVVAGGITVRQDAQRTQVTQSEQRGIVDWRSFNIGSDHRVQFQQPSSQAITLNRVTTPDPSVIAGRISANGQIAIVNQSGVVFSQGAQVEAAGLIVSAAGITNQNFLAGRMVFDQPPRPGARVENQGRITIREAGLAALVAPQVANRGTITARLGRVALAGAETHTVDLYGDGMLAVEVTGKVRQAPGGGAALVTNTGVIEARGGTVQLSAEAVDGIVQDLVRVGGRVAADTDVATGRGGRVMIAGTGGAVRIAGNVRAVGTAPGTRGGTVEVLGDRVLVESGGRVNASGAAGGGDIALGTTLPGAAQPRLARRTGIAAGAVVRADATVSGKGGSVRMNSAEYTEHAGRISTRGGPQGGDGGFVDVSGQQGLRAPGRIDASAPQGTPGTILFDPVVLEIVPRGTTPLPPNGVLGPNDPPTNATISASEISNFTGNVVLGATQDIFVRTQLIAGSTVGSLTMTAGRDIQVDASIEGFQGLELTAQTGELRLNARLFGNGTTVLTAGGGITASDTVGSIDATSLRATAGGTITLGSGSVSASLTLSGGPATFSAGQDVLVQTRLSSGSPAGLLTLTGGRDVQVDAPIGGFAGLNVTAQTGDLRLNAPLAGNGATTLTAGGNVTLADTVGSINATSLRITAGNDVTIGSPGAATVSITLDGGPATIAAGRDVFVRSSLLGGSSVGSLLMTATRDIRITAPITGFPGMFIGAGTDAATLGVIPGSAGALRIDGAVSSTGAMHLQAGLGGIAQTAGIAATNLSVTTPGSATLDQLSGGVPANRIDTLIGAEVDGDLSLAASAFTNASAPIALQGTIRVGGRLSLRAENGATQAASPPSGPANAIISGALLGEAPAGGFSLLGDNRIGTLTFVGGDLLLRTVSDLEIGPATGITSQGSVQVNVTGRLTVTGNVIGQAVQMQASNDVEVQASVSGEGVAIDAGRDLTVEGSVISVAGGAAQLRAGRTLTLTAGGSVSTESGASLTLLSAVDFAGGGVVDPTAPGGLRLAGTVMAAQGGAVVMGAGTGGILQSGGSVEGGSLSVVPSGGDALLGQTGNAIGQLGSVDVAGRFLLESGVGNLAVLGPVSAQSIGLRTPNILTIQRSAVLTAPRPGGSIGLASGTLVIEPGAQITAETVEIAPFAAAPMSVAGVSGAITADTLRIGAVTFPDTGPDPVTTASSITLAAPLSFGGRLDLRSTGGITQVAGANLDVGALTGTAGGPVTLTSAGNLVGALDGFLVSGGNSFALTVAGDLVLTGPLTVAGGSVALNVGGALSQTANGVITAASLAGSAGNGAALDTAVNDIGALAGFVVSGGNAFALTVIGDLALTGPLTAAGGSVALNVGGALSQTANGVITAASLAGSAGGGVALDAAVNDVSELDGFAVSGGNAFALTVGGDLVLTRPLTVAGGGVALTVGGALSQTAAGVVTAVSLAGSAGGGVALDTALNDIGALAGFVVSGGNAFALTVIGDLALTGPLTVAGGSVALTVGGALSQTATGVITAASLAGSAGGGAALDAAANDIGTLDGFVVSGGNVFSLRTTGDLALTGPLTAAGGRVELNVGGALSQTANGIITAARLAGSAVSGAALDTTVNDIGVLAGFVVSGGNTFALTVGGDLVLTRPLTVAGGSVALNVGGALSQTATGVVTAASLAGNAGGGAALDTAVNDIGALAGFVVSGGNAFALTVIGDLALTGPLTVAGGSVALNVGGVLSQTASGIITAASLAGSAGGGAVLDAVVNDIGTLGGFTVSGGNAFALAVSGDLALTGPLAVSGRSVQLNVGGLLSQTQGGAVTAARLAGSAGGGAALDAAANNVGALDGFIVSGGSAFALRTSGDLTLTGPLVVAGGTVQLNVAGVLSQTANGTITAASLAGSAGGGAVLDAAANNIGALDGFVVSGGNAFALAVTGDLALTGPLSVSGGSVQLNVGGLLSQTQTGVITAARLTGSAGGGAALDAAANDVGALAGFDAGTGDFAFVTIGSQLAVLGNTTVQAGAGLAIVATNGGLTIDGTVSGEAVSLRAASDLVVNGFSAIARSGDLLLAADRVTVAGLIQAGRTLSVQARTAASLSGRAVSTGSPTAPPGGLTVSAPQISFGGLDARSIPVTLALGTIGFATGSLDAGGLTVQGGVGATLAGSIQGVQGGPAAALGQRATAAGVPLTEPLPNATDFTMNGCPIGVAICQPIVPVPPPPPPPAPPPSGGGGVVPVPPAVITSTVLVPLAQNPLAVIAVLEPANLIPQAERLRPRTVLPEMRIARDRSEEEELAPPDVRRDDY